MAESDETAFRRAMYARLRCDATWNAYADWLRDHGRDGMADRMPVLRKMLIDRLPVALPIAEFAPPEECP